MKFKITDLDKGINKFYQEVNASALNLEDYEDAGFNLPIKVYLEIEKKNLDEFNVSGEIETTAVMECGRCAKKYNWQIDTKFLLFYLRRYSKDHGDLDPEDLITFKLEGYEIDLTDRIRESLILEVPMKPLCHPDCKGLCPYCGQDFNDGECDCEDNIIDSRWAPLLEVKDEMTS